MNSSVDCRSSLTETKGIDLLLASAVTNDRFNTGSRGGGPERTMTILRYLFYRLLAKVSPDSTWLCVIRIASLFINRIRFSHEAMPRIALKKGESSVCRFSSILLLQINICERAKLVIDLVP